VRLHAIFDSGSSPISRFLERVFCQHRCPGLPERRVRRVQRYKPFPIYVPPVSVRRLRIIEHGVAFRTAIPWSTYRGSSGLSFCQVRKSSLRCLFMNYGIVLSGAPSEDRAIYSAFPWRGLKRNIRTSSLWSYPRLLLDPGVATRITSRNFICRLLRD
jgi:hypothetical protein